jgi:hypothetical protein
MYFWRGLSVKSGDMNLNSKNRHRGTATALIVFALSSAGAQAGETYYRWQDASGTMVNSDRPPPAGMEYDVITTDSSSTRQVNSREDVSQKQSISLDHKLEGEPASGQAPAPPKDQKACEHAQQNLLTLNTSARIRVPDGNGNYRYLNEDEKAVQRNNAEAVITKNCD